MMVNKDNKNFIFSHLIFIFLMLVSILTLFNVNINNVEAAVVNVGDTQDFDYTGTVQEFIAPYNGYYKLETWGAEGGVPTGANANFEFYDGTRWKYYSLSHAPGSYVTGKIFLNKKQKIYIVVGGKGTYVLNSKSLYIKGGYNGGGDKIYDFPTDGYVSSIQNSGSGGGATHIAFYPGILSELENHKNDNGIIMVAGGGSGASYFEGVKNDGTTELAGFYGSSGQGLYITTPWTSCTSNGNLCGNDYIFDNNLRVYQTTNNRGGFYIDASDPEYNSMYNNGEIVYSIPTNAINKSFFGQGGSYFTGGGGGYYGGTGGIYKYNVGGLSYVNNDLLDEKHVVCETCDVENNKNEQEITTSLNFHDRGKDIATENKPKNLDGYARVTLVEKTKDNNTKLSTLNASNGQYGFFTSSFDPNTTVYSVNVPNSVTALNVTATPEETTTTVAGTGVKQLTEDDTVITVITTAEDGSIGTYTINVHRLSDNAYLSDIKINLNSIENFNSETLDYNLNVDPYMSQINIQAIKGQNGQTLSYKRNPNLKYGENTVTILVTAEDGSTNIYTLNITRERLELIQNIEVEGFTINPSFNSSTTTYDVDVYNQTEKVNVIVTLNDESTTVVGDGEVELTGDLTTHEIVVTDEDDNSYTYTLKIHKAYDGNKKIKTIQFGKNKIEYRVRINNDETNYQINVPFDYTNFNTVNINTDNEEQSFKYKLNGNYIEDANFNLTEITNPLIVEVYDGMDRLLNTYTVNIIRTKSDVATLSNLTVKKGRIKETFNKDTFNYTWVIPKDVTTLTNNDVEVTLTDPDGSVNIPTEVTYSQDGDKFNIVVLAADQTSTNTYELSLERDLSNDARLKTLTASKGVFDPSFDMDTNNYTLNTYDNVNKITFTAETNDEDATIISNLENITVDENIPYNITVQAEDGTINTYVINISKSISSNNEIQKIQIGHNQVDYTVSLNEDETDYTLNVPYQYYFFNYINVISNNNNLIYKYYINDRIIEDEAALNEGSNLFKVEVYNEINDLVNTYNITINRNKSSDANLKSLNVKYGDLTPTFKKNTTTYTWKVPKNTTQVLNSDIEAEANEEHAYVHIPGITQVTDNASVVVRVTAEDDATIKEYTINLVHDTSNEARLKNVSVETGKLRTKFKKDTYSYHVDTYTDASSVNIIAESIDEDATITGDGTVTLTGTDTTHTITVVSEDTTVTKEYTLYIHKTIDRSDYTISSVKIGNDNTASYNVLYQSGEYKKTQAVAADFKIFNYIEAVTTNPSLTFKYYINDEEITTEGKVLEGANNVKIEAYDNNEKVATYYITLTRTRTEPGQSSGGSSSIDIGESQVYTECTTENEFVTPESGYYQIEAWGGTSEYSVGSIYDHDPTYVPNHENKGGYSTGVVLLKFGETIYPVPGGNGKITRTEIGGAGGCNGGGSGGDGFLYYDSSKDRYHLVSGGTGGGGASHVAFRKGMLSDLENNKEDVLIVASGGTGYSGSDLWSTDSRYGLWLTNLTPFAPGGGVEGVISGWKDIKAKPRSPYSKENNYSNQFGYAFGKGQDASTYAVKQSSTPTGVPSDAILINYAGGAGSGFYGGAQNDYPKSSRYSPHFTNVSSGSGFINSDRLISYADVTKQMRVKAPKQELNDKIYDGSHVSNNSSASSENANNSSYLTYYSYENPNLYEEDEYGMYKFPDSGMIKITYMGPETSLNLSSLIVQGYSLNTVFDPETYTYSVSVDTDTIEIAGEPEDESNVVTGLGIVSVESGTNAHDIIVTSPDGDTQIYTLTITRSASTYSNLDNIVIDGEPISGFDPETYTYNLETDKNSLTIDPVKGHDGQTLEYTSPVTVNPGNNSYTIKVTAEDGTSKQTYTINIHKDVTIGLSSLSVDGFNIDPEFDKDTLEYDLRVYKNTESININASLLDSNVATLSGDGNISITSDNMTHYVIAKSKTDDTEVKYKINIKRNVETSDVLKKIEITNDSIECKTGMCVLDPKFSGTKIGYTMNVPYAYDSFDLNITKDNNEQTYKTILNGVETSTYNLNEGENVLKVELYDGLEKLVRTYTVIINRNKSGDATLKSLTSNKGTLTPAFDSNEVNYVLNVYDNETSVVLQGETNDDNARVVSGLGEIELTGNTTTNNILVKAEDNTEKTYTVQIKKTISSNITITNLKVISNKGELEKDKEFSTSTKTYSVDIPYRNNLKEIKVISNSDQISTKIKLNNNYVDNYELDENENEFDVEIYDGLNNLIDSYKVNVNRVKSDVATLDSLTVNVGSIKETFDKDTLTYTWIIPKNISEVKDNNISYKLTDELSTVNVPSSVTFENEGDSFDVEVTAENGSSKNTYKLLLEYEKHTDSLLKSLEVEGFSLRPEFNSNTNNYDVYVYTDTNNVTVNAETNSEYASIISGTGNIELLNDEQENSIIVQSEDGTINTYYLSFKKIGTSDNSIENIRIYNDDITCESDECVYDKEFNQDITEYSMTVPYNYKNFKVDVVTPNNQITNKVLVNGVETTTYNLSVGNNEVQVKVYDAVGKIIDTYLFNIERKESDNNYLSRLSISGYDLSPEFNKETQEYYIELDNNTSSIPYNSFYVKTEDSRATCLIDGYNYLFNDRNIINITVIAPNGDKRKYIIQAYKGTPTNLSDLNVTKINGDLLELNPKFNGMGTNNTYFLRVPFDVDKVNVNAVAEYSEDVTITGDGLHDLKIGTNDIALSVINNTGNISIYRILITREVDTDVDLVSLSVDEAIDPINFYTDIYSYDMEAVEGTKELTIHAVPSSSSAIVEIIGNKIYPTYGMDNESASDRKNKVKITVYNSNKTIKKEYILNVTKKANDNVNVKDLRIIDANNNVLDLDYPIFDENYSETFLALVPDDIEKLYLEVDPESNVSRPYYLDYSGSNFGRKAYFDNDRFEKEKDYHYFRFPFYVQAESGRIKPYSIFLADEQSSNVYLESAKIRVIDRYSNNNKTYDIEYNENTGNYEVDIDEINPYYELLFTPNQDEYSISMRLYYNGEKFYAKKNYYTLDYVYSPSKNLSSGTNEFKLNLLSNVVNKEYNFVINSGVDNSTYIKNLTTSGVLDKSFNKTEQEYNVDVRKNVRSLDLGIELESKTSTYEIIGNENFKESKTNEVIIRVTAKNGDTRDYKLNVNLRDDDYFVEGAENIIVKDSNNDELTLSPTFDMDTNHYNVTVPYGTEYVNLEVVKANSSQVIRIDGTDEEYGKRRIDIDSEINNVVVNILRGNKNKEYTITINRLKNNDASLSSLSIKNNDEIVNISPDFNSKTTSYTASVDNTVAELNVLATTTDPNASYYVLGSNYLVGGSNTVKVIVTAEDGTTTKEYNITVEKDKSTNNYLSSLSVENHEISPEFDKNTKKYSLTVNKEISNINILAQAEDSRSTVTGIGNKELNVGLNTFNISVTSESGEINTYELEVTRKEGTNSLLESLFISEGKLSPTFDSETLDYTLTVSDSVDEVNIIGIPMDNGATVSGNRYYDVSETATIKVTSEDSSSETEYNITIVKEGFKSAFLKKLKVNNGIMTPDFKKTTLIYSIEVQNEINELDLEYEAEDSEAITSISGNSNLVVGQNKVEITVTSSDGFSTNTYELYVTKKEEGNNYLSYLEVENNTISPEFNKETLSYTLTVGTDISSINILATPEDPDATIDGDGIVNIDYGLNEIRIDVTSTNNIVRTYIINVTREKSNENYLLSLTSDIGEFDKEFDKDINEYTLTLPLKTMSIELDGTVSNNSTVNGLGEVVITSYEFTHNIYVTSQNGEVNIYKVNIIKPKSNNTNLISLVPDIGNIEYSNDITEYEMTVDSRVVSIEFEAIPEDRDATIKGIGNRMLSMGENIITIEVTAEDGVTKRNINIKVTRKASFTDFEIEEEVKLIKGQTFELHPKGIPTNEDIEVTYTIDNEEIISIENNVVTGLEKGSTTVTVMAVEDPAIEKEITVNVYSDTLESEIYTIGDKEKGRVSIYKDPIPKTTIEDYLNGYTNEKTMLKVYDKEDNLVEDYTEIIKTGMKVKLEYGNVVYDEVKVIVLGDIDENGLINVTDQTIIQNHIVGISIIDDYRIYAMDLSLDDKINVTDQVEHIKYLISH